MTVVFFMEEQNTRGCVHLVHTDNTNMGLTLDFGLEDFGLWDWLGISVFLIPVLNCTIQASTPAAVFSSVRFSYTIQSGM